MQEGGGGMKDGKRTTGGNWRILKEKEKPAERERERRGESRTKFKDLVFCPAAHDERQRDN